MRMLKHKAFAYITAGDRLLVFRHPDAPEAGVQVPAGTIEKGERPEDAVMREAYEETGLRDLTLVRFLGEQARNMEDYGRGEIHHRYFYHLRLAGHPPDSWRHVEHDRSDGGATAHTFEFFWVRLPDEVPALIADHGAMLPVLLAGDADSIKSNPEGGEAPCRRQ
jgi:8-oxo-dGTP pyrophosphatase MutT (NUDIX family)